MGNDPKNPEIATPDPLSLEAIRENAQVVADSMQVINVIQDLRDELEKLDPYKLVDPAAVSAQSLITIVGIHEEWLRDRLSHYLFEQTEIYAPYAGKRISLTSIGSEGVEETVTGVFDCLTVDLDTWSESAVGITDDSGQRLGYPVKTITEITIL